ncbi:MAG: alpha-glucosidase [Myxococcota bacterium]|nr:alpha-glucosidase [Myxococcota bacterium]
MSIDAAIESFDMVFGPCRLVWAERGTGNWQLSLIRNEKIRRVLWASVPGVPFLTLTTGTHDIRESRGFFKVREQVTGPIFDQLTLTSVSPDGSGDGIELRGLSRANGHPSPIEWTLNLRLIDEVQIQLALRADDPRINRLALVYEMDPDAHIFGFGAQFTHLNMQGRRIPILCQEPGIGRGIQPLTWFMNALAGAGGQWHTTNIAVPHYLTSMRQSLCLENTTYSVFDFEQPGRAKVSVHDTDLRARIFAGETPKALIESYTRFGGRMRPLPDWIHQGAVIGLQGGTRTVEHMHDVLRRHNTPIAAFWLQDWIGQRRTSIGWQLWWNWEVDHDHYPGWDDLVDALAGEGIRVMTYLNPFLVDPSEKGTFERNLYAEAKANGYLVKHADGTPYMILNTSFSAALIDLANPDACAWIKSVIQTQLIERGASGWMADFAEALPFDAQIHGAADADAFHNQYPVEWARVNREAIEASGRGDELVFFTRAGFTGSPKYSTLFWLGDQLTSWRREDGIQSTVNALLATGFSGFAFNHTDIGGYIATTVPRVPFRLPGISFTRSKALLLRWIELNAFTPIYRTHEGNQPARHWQIDGDEETTAHFARFARVYRAFADYRIELGREAHATGLPLIRHLWLEFPDDSDTLMYEQQFMLGAQVLVAPVMVRNKTRMTVYLPPGDWIHLWTGARSTHGQNQGQRYDVPAPVGAPPVFYRAQWAGAATVVASLSQHGDLETGLAADKIFIPLR